MMRQHPFSEPGPYTHPIVGWTITITLAIVAGLFLAVLWVAVPGIIRLS